MAAYSRLQPIRSLPLLLAGLLLAVPASAAIYRWTDSSGVIHYSQTPPTSGQTHNLVQLPETGSDVGAVPATQSDAASKAGAKNPKGADKAKGKPKKKAAAKPKAKAPETPEQRAARCRKARATLTEVQTHTRIRIHEANGSTEQMSETQRQQKIQSLKKTIVKDCS